MTAELLQKCVQAVTKIAQDGDEDAAQALVENDILSQEEFAVIKLINKRHTYWQRNDIEKAL